MSTYFAEKENNIIHKIGTVYKGNIKIGQIYKGNKLVYQSAFKIIYVVDTNKTYEENVAPKKTILSPTTFAPVKEGWTFVGWRYDTVASSTVLTDEISTGHITLYAVFKQTVKRLFISNGTQTVQGTRYYNNGNIVNATITAPNGINISGWNWRGWSDADVTSATADVAYSNGSQISNVATEATHYGLYYRNCSQTTSWSCGWCGTNVQGATPPGSCPNNVCGSGTSGQKWYPASSRNWTEWYSGSGAGAST